MATDSTSPSRRRFLGLGALAAAGAGLGISHTRLTALVGEADVHWMEADGFPDRPMQLLVRLRKAPDRPVSVRLVVMTPTETVTLSLGEHELAAGETALGTQLVYPYDDFVVGDYAYHAELTVDGALVATTSPATYHVAPFAWFS